MDSQLDIFAEVSRGVALEKGIKLIDLRKSFVEYLAVNNTENVETGILTNDGVHLNDAGNRFVADEILKRIDE